jgi:hypothetical protein
LRKRVVAAPNEYLVTYFGLHVSPKFDCWRMIFVIAPPNITLDYLGRIGNQSLKVSLIHGRPSITKAQRRSMSPVASEYNRLCCRDQ